MLPSGKSQMGGISRKQFARVSRAVLNAGIETAKRRANFRSLLDQRVDHQSGEEQGQVHAGITVHAPGDFIASHAPQFPGG